MRSEATVNMLPHQLSFKCQRDGENLFVPEKASVDLLAVATDATRGK